VTAQDNNRKEALKVRIRDIVDCGCCPLNEDAVEKVATFLLDGLGYTNDELSTLDVADEIDSLYHHEIWTYGTRKEHDDDDN
jgi:hypothetical protein